MTLGVVTLAAVAVVPAGQWGNLLGLGAMFFFGAWCLWRSCVQLRLGWWLPGFTICLASAGILTPARYFGFETTGLMWLCLVTGVGGLALAMAERRLWLGRSDQSRIPDQFGS